MAVDGAAADDVQEHETQRLQLPWEWDLRGQESLEHTGVDVADDAELVGVGGTDDDDNW